MKAHKFWTALFLSYSLLIFYLSSIPLENAPMISQASGRVPYFDKIGHISEYFIYGLIAFRALRPRTKRALFLSILFLLSYALSDEVHQYFVPFRDPDISDFLADSIGLGLAGFLSLERFASRKQPQMKAPSSA